MALVYTEPKTYQDVLIYSNEMSTSRVVADGALACGDIVEIDFTASPPTAAKATSTLTDTANGVVLYDADDGELVTAHTHVCLLAADKVNYPSGSTQGRKDEIDGMLAATLIRLR